MNDIVELIDNRYAKNWARLLAIIRDRLKEIERAKSIDIFLLNSFETFLTLKFSMIQKGIIRFDQVTSEVMSS